MRRPQLGGHLLLGRHGVNRNEWTSSGQARAQDRGQPDPAGAKDSDAASRTHLRLVEHRPDPGRHSASDDRPDAERHFFLKRHTALLWHHGVFGKTGQRAVVIDGLSVF